MAKSKNEHTSVRVAKIAAKVLADKYERAQDRVNLAGPLVLYWRDIRALAASALTQAPDKPPRG